MRIETELSLGITTSRAPRLSECGPPIVHRSAKRVEIGNGETVPLTSALSEARQ
jgi:hypothetical protein